MASETVDYVIVGAGSAGCVLANRLSADGDTTVLVLEAGGPDDKREIAIPAAFSELFKTDVDWDYTTVPQPELADRELYWPRGKAIGGSSSINAMIHIRGHPADYDGWADRGNDGWAFDDLLPYFKLLEDDTSGSTEWHGRGGPMHVERPDPPELSAAWIDAAVAAGLPRNDDFNAGDNTGVGPFPVNQRGGRRHSAADGYLTPALDRRNLEARTGAHVTRVLFDGPVATGVEYEKDGERVRVAVGEEVIVCGGAVNSPQLLMLSGVGPADHLGEHDIDAVHDLPGVGRNLQDHLVVGRIYESRKPVTIDDADSLLNVLRWLVFKSGPLTSNVAEVGAFCTSDDDRTAPDLQFHFGRAYYERHGFERPDAGHYFSFGPTLLTPESSGRITLASANPTDHPTIDPQYLSDGDDLDRLVRGMELAREIADQAPLDEYRGDEIIPGSDADLRQHVRDHAATIYHPVGTCKMGQDDMAVVDERLRVRGVEGLRVVDASIMPTVTRGNTNIPTIAIAERAADLVRGDVA